MEFTQYPKINGPFANGAFDGLRGKEVVVTEKIHGSNLAAYIYRDENDKIVFQWARRTSFIGPDENFFSIHTVLKDFIPVLKKLFVNCCADTMVIVGEFYGGNYFGDSDPNTKIIQKGDYSNYSTSNGFVIFDIKIDDTWQLWDDVKTICYINRIHHTPEIGRGVFEDIQKDIEVEGMTSMFARILNPHSDKESLAEGVVVRLIRPAKEELVGELADPRLKLKCSGMLERGTKSVAMCLLDEALVSEALGMMNQARFDSYKSKVGPEQFTMKNIGKNLNALINDIYDDIVISRPNKLTMEQEKELRCELKKKVYKKLAGCARSYIMDFMESQNI